MHNQEDSSVQSEETHPYRLHFPRSIVQDVCKDVECITRRNFIGEFKYRSIDFAGEPGSHFILQLTGDEASFLTLRFNVTVRKLDWVDSWIVFKQSADNYYAE